MDMMTFKTFILWCTLINLGILLFSTLMIAAMPDLIHRLQSRFFGISREVFDVAVYSYLGIFKIIWIIFNFTPCLVLYFSL